MFGNLPFKKKDYNIMNRLIIMCIPLYESLTMVNKRKRKKIFKMSFSVLDVLVIDTVGYYLVQKCCAGT